MRFWKNKLEADMKELNERLDKQTEERDRKIHSQQNDLKNKEF